MADKSQNPYFCCRAPVVRVLLSLHHLYSTLVGREQLALNATRTHRTCTRWMWERKHQLLAQNMLIAALKSQLAQQDVKQAQVTQTLANYLRRFYAQWDEETREH